MEILEIEQPEVIQILTRNTATKSNFLSQNKYQIDPKRSIRNSQFIAWVYEEQLDLNIFRQKLLKNDLKKSQRKLYRSELRYLPCTFKDSIEIEYHEKYKSFKVGSVFQNARIDQFDISQHYVVCLITDGNISIIDMISSSQILIKHDEQPFFQLIMCENQSEFFYVLDKQFNLFCISLVNGAVVHKYLIQNYPLFVGNHEGEKIRLIKLRDQGYVLYSEQNYLFYFEANPKSNCLKQNAMIKKSHFVQDLTYNLIVSELKSNIFMINNSISKKYYLLFTSDIKSYGNPQQFFNQISKNMYNTHSENYNSILQSSANKGGNNLQSFISKFESKRQIYKLIKRAWSLKICKLFNKNDNDYYYYVFSNYIISELNQILIQQDISFLELLQITVILLMQIKPSDVTSLLLQLDTLVAENRIKNQIWQKIWEFIPFYDVEREQNESDYKQQYIDICKILGTENQINFLQKEY